MGRSTYSGPLKSKNGFELNDTEDVSLAAAEITGGSNSLSVTTAQAVEVGAPTASHKLKITINGTEYWIPLDEV